MTIRRVGSRSVGALSWLHEAIEPDVIREPARHMPRISITVNRTAHEVEVESHQLLSSLLRDTLRLTGTHIGCDTSQCGACTVIVDGVSVKSCTMLAVEADGLDVTTIEGLADGDALHPMQAAFREHHGLQCGFCTPGMIMAGVAFAERNPNPTEEEVRQGLEGNLCRCTGYQNIVDAIMAGARSMQAARS
jgi:carbon-monoxide dehydrogenase small subunit